MTPAPVSQALEAELLQEVNRQGIVVWLDKDASYSVFVDRLADRHRAGTFPYPVIGFRGSFLETLFALEPYASGYDKHALIVHMPGYTEDSIRKTPLLELYEAGTRFRKALDTLIRQAAASRVLPEEVDAYLKQKPSLEQADAWLAQGLSRKSVGLESPMAENGSPSFSLTLSATRWPPSSSMISKHLREVPYWTSRPAWPSFPPSPPSA